MVVLLARKSYEVRQNPGTKKKQNPNEIRNKRRIENFVNIFAIFFKKNRKKHETIFTKKKKRFNIVHWTFLSFTDGPDKAIDVTSRVHLRFEF